MYVNRKISTPWNTFRCIQFKVIPFTYGTSIIKYIDISVINGMIIMDLYWTVSHSESISFKKWKEFYRWIKENRIKRRGTWDIIESPKKIKLPENIHTRIL